MVLQSQATTDAEFALSIAALRFKHNIPEVNMPRSARAHSASAAVVVTVSTPVLPLPHSPQLARHSFSMCALFAPVHSPIAFHPSQCVDLSAHAPPLIVSARQC